MGNSHGNRVNDCKAREKSLQKLEENAFKCHESEDASQRSPSSLGQVDKEARLVRIEDYEFPFENLIFEGGGNKSLAYIGSVKCLEDIGMMSQIKRVAGCSSGAITAVNIALGYTTTEAEAFLSENMEDVILDHSCGYLSLLPNLIKRFGWNPGKAIYNWFGDRIQAKSAKRNPDMTFLDLYKEKNVELCIVVTNVNQMRTEYCHIKTTPDMPIREALRMSIGVPGLFAAAVHQNKCDTDLYVDGGVLCNYPLHCFDGWYLSMSPDDTFLQKMAPLNNLRRLMFERFKETNLKSLGFKLYDDQESDLLRFELEQRVGSHDPPAPSQKTKLYETREKKRKMATHAEREHGRTVAASDAFINALKRYNLTDKEFITKDELTKALQDKQLFPEEYSNLLFGPNITLDKAFRIIDEDGSGKIAFRELIQFIEAHGIRMQERFQGYSRADVENVGQFFLTLGNTVLTNMPSAHLKKGDEDRTVGVNTGYVFSSDYTLEDADREFLLQRGYNATKAFLQYYVVKNPQTKRKQNVYPSVK